MNPGIQTQNLERCNIVQHCRSEGRAHPSTEDLLRRGPELCGRLSFPDTEPLYYRRKSVADTLQLGQPCVLRTCVVGRVRVGAGGTDARPPGGGVGQLGRLRTCEKPDQLEICGKCTGREWPPADVAPARASLQGRGALGTRAVAAREQERGLGSIGLLGAV